LHEDQELPAERDNLPGDSAFSDQENEKDPKEDQQQEIENSTGEQNRGQEIKMSRSETPMENRTQKHSSDLEAKRKN
jgi:hypothetical protein